MLMTPGEDPISKSRDARSRTKWEVEVTAGHKPDGGRIRSRRTVGSYAAAVILRRRGRPGPKFLTIGVPPLPPGGQ
jgi:hypothetical protein